jgi:hypothetical protein
MAMRRHLTYAATRATVLGMALPATASAEYLTMHEARTYLEEVLEKKRHTEWEVQGCRRLNSRTVLCREEDWFERETDPGWNAICADTVWVSRGWLHASLRVVEINTK